MGAGEVLRSALLLWLFLPGTHPVHGATTINIQEHTWPIGVTIQSGPMLTDHEYNATDWAPVRITSPVDGSVLRGDSVLLSFEVSASVLHRLAYIEARASDEEVTRVGPGVRQLTLHGVEPGTHHVSLWLLDGQEACIGQADVLWDTAFPEGEMLTHRLLSRPEPPPPLRLSSSSRSAGVEGGPRRIKLCFVTSLKLDGQRMIYLQQLQRLPRERYEMVVLNNHSPRAREEEGRVFVQQLADMAIPLVRTSGLSVAVDDVEAALGEGNATEDSIVAYTLARLQANGGVVDENLGPPWVRHVLDSLTQAIRVVSPDILVFANGRTAGDALLSACARLAGVRHVVLELPNLFPRVPMPGLDLIIAPSHYAAQHESVQSLVRDPASTARPAHQPLLPTAVITPGVDEARFFPLGRYPALDDGPPCHSMCMSRDSPVVCDPDCVVVAYMGRLDPEKSPGLFLHMAARVRATHPTARFQVIGYGYLRAALEQRARAMGLGPEVLSFAGQVYDDLPFVLRRVGVIVNPSLRAWSETFCIANVEAMGSGVPVVSFGVGGTGEYLQHDVNSILVDEDEPEGLARAVRELLDDPGKRQRLSLQARSTVLQDFTVRKQIERYDRLYMHLVD